MKELAPCDYRNSMSTWWEIIEVALKAYKSLLGNTSLWVKGDTRL